MAFDPEQHYEMAYFKIYTVYTSGLINLIVIVFSSAIALYGKAKEIFTKRNNRTNKCDAAAEKEETNCLTSMICCRRRKEKIVKATKAEKNEKKLEKKD